MAKFKPRARSLDLLGRQQIADSSTALNELFKNAYDAYADHVQVDYYKKHAILLLRDDGFGMTQEDFETRWLTIGTESKLETKFGISKPVKRDKKMTRPVMGEKGIGRLAIAALGVQVLIISKAKNNKNQPSEYVLSFINWSMFELPGVDLDEIEIQVETFQSKSDINPDNVQTMINKAVANLNFFKGKVDKVLFNRIQTELESFNIPAALYNLEMDGPNIHNGGTCFIIAPVDKHFSEEVESNSEENASNLHLMLCGFTNTISNNKIKFRTNFIVHDNDKPNDDLIAGKNFFTAEDYKDSDHHVSGEFDEYGNFKGELSIYQMKPEKIEFKLRDTKRKTECGPFNFNFAYLQGNQKDSTLDQQRYAQLKAKCNKMGGIFVYRDGIRILPFGRPDFDFLEVERRRTKRASTYFFSYRRLIGAIDLTRQKNGKLEEKAGREGFISNRAYREFRDVLENFLIELAQKYFSDDKEYSKNYQNEKARLVKEHETRIQREKDVIKHHKALNKHLDSYFKIIEQTQVLDKFTSQLERELKEVEKYALDTLNKYNDSDVSPDVFLKLDTVVQEKYHKITVTVLVSREVGFGLSKELERRWTEYERSYEEVVTPLIKSSKAKIFALIADHAKKLKVQLDSKKRLKNVVLQSLNTSFEELKQKEVEVQNEKNKIFTYVSEITKESDNKKVDLEASINNQIANLDKNISETKASIVKIDLEKQINDLSVEMSLSYRKLMHGLKNLSNSPLSKMVSDSDALQALETKVVALEEEYEENLENIQIGLAIKVINHEFESNIHGVRKSIAGLKNWAAKNDNLKNIYNDIRDGFDHLDTYLNLFTPLERRLRRRATKITGKSISDFLTKLFEERLLRDGIQLEVTKSFVNYSIDTYASTLYPVFINLIDNALYWLSTTNNVEKIITLDADNNGFIVRDNGSGISRPDQSYIFDRGFSKKTSGGGMGLYIAKTVLNRERLDIQLISSSKGHTEFKIIELQQGENDDFRNL